MPEDVQPTAPEPAEDGGSTAEGQGDSGEGLYDLSSVPEDLRPHVEAQLKAIDGNITRKFQSHAEEMRQWEPYEELGVNQIDPQSLGQLLEFAELAQDQEAFGEWWHSVGERMGLLEGDDEGDDFDDLDFEDLSAEQIEQLVSEKVAETVNPIYETLEESERERAEQETLTEIQEQLDTLIGDADADRDAVLRLAYAYADDDPDNAIQNGWEDYKRLVGMGEAGLFAKKAGQPGPVEGPGSADTRATPILTFEEAKPAALERLRKSNANA